MREALQALLALQEIDRDIFRVQAELKRLPLERQGKKAELDKRTARLAEVKNESLKLRVRIKELEDQTTVQRQRMRKLENEANNSRADMALVVAYQHEIRTLKRDVGTAEEEGLQWMEKVEALNAQSAELAAQIEKEQKTFDEFSANVEREYGDAKKRLAELSKARSTLSSSEIPPEKVAIYNRLLAARSGVALAQLQGRVCQGCYMEVPQNLYVRVQRGTELVQCPSCDRILHQPA
ncbi:MAG: zinc ribbon domain-containing protein [Planctomycetota bacterium]